MARPIWVRGLVGLTTLAFVWAFVWAWLAWQGVPAFFPDWAEGLLRMAPGID
jgi:hypothetical protein